jgi:hypothetical protein
MHTVTLQINDELALKTLQELESRHFIRILDHSETDEPSLPGNPLTLPTFKQWVADAENAPAVSLIDAKEQWAQKREQLQRLTR